MESRSLLVSDVDGTLLGDDEALARFAQWHAKGKNHVRLAYNSGRFFHSVLESVAATQLPLPDAIIGGVGTEIYFPASGQRLRDWPACDEGWNTAWLRGLSQRHAELELQPEEFQSPGKISFFGHRLSANFLQTLAAELALHSQRVQMVYSSERDLDLLPEGANKGTAAARLARHWNIPAANVLVSGDSGNDLAMFEQGFCGIVVGNAHAELKRLRAPNIFQAAATHADGVLEGLHHWLEGDGLKHRQRQACLAASQ